VVAAGVIMVELDHQEVPAVVALILEVVAELLVKVMPADQAAEVLILQVVVVVLAVLVEMPSILPLQALVV
jgi:hypothetical protein